MRQPPRRGGVYMVVDTAINLPPDDKRTYHPQRPVIVVSGDAKNLESSWPIVLVVPTSTQSTRKTQYCVKLGQGVGNLPSRCWARVVCVQPIAKNDLGDFLGMLRPEHLEDLIGNLFAYMELVD